MHQTIEKLFDLNGKVALITGGAMGIGKGIAIKLAQAGAAIMIVDIAPASEAESTIKEIKDQGGNVS